MIALAVCCKILPTPVCRIAPSKFGIGGGGNGEYKAETFRRSPAGGSSPVELDQQPEASLASYVGNPSGEA